MGDDTYFFHGVMCRVRFNVFAQLSFMFVRIDMFNGRHKIICNCQNQNIGHAGFILFAAGSYYFLLCYVFFAVG